MLLTANIFQPLIDVFDAVLKFFHNSVGVPWGWAIVLLTVVIRALLLPLTVKQFHSMQKLQRLQPEMKALQARYKEDKQRQQQELMKFYKENQINPLGSCLPLAAQLPVFLSLYYALRQNLRPNICPAIQKAYEALHHGATTACGPHGGAHFLFISDLTNQAKGVTLVVLIILYIGTQLGSSLLMSTPTMDKTQRQIMLAMPLFFVILIIRFPAGVIVYWITTNTWTILQQYFVKRRIAAAEPAEPVVAAGTNGRSTVVAARGAQPDGAGTRANGSDGAAATGLAGLGARLRGRKDPEDGASVTTKAKARPAAAPPPPPRKKKKRSGRRR